MYARRRRTSGEELQELIDMLVRAVVGFAHHQSFGGRPRPTVPPQPPETRHR